MARPASSRRQSDRTGATAPSRPVLREFGRAAASYTVEWDVRPVYDFLISLSDDAGSTEDLPAEDRHWLSEAKAALPSSIRDDLAVLLGSEACIHVVSIVPDRNEIQTARDFVDALETMDVPTVVRSIFGDALRTPESNGLVEQALAGDSKAIEQLEDRIRAEHKGKEQLSILRDPERTVARLVNVLKAWVGPFGAIEPRVASMIRRDVDDRAGEIATLGPVDLVEGATGGIRWLSEEGVSRVILAPSYFARPYNYLFAAGDWRLFAYPIADSALDVGDPLAPPPSVVRLYRALGDPTRLRILKLLSEGDRYLTEIAEQVELSKPTVKHHLAQLRSAGLVTLIEAGTLTYYSLRREHLEETGTELRRFLIE